MLAILAFGWAGVSILVSVALTATSLYVGNEQYSESKDRADRAEDKNEENMAKQERKAKVMHLKEFNVAVAQFNKGTLTSKREILETERKEANGGYNMGQTAEASNVSSLQNTPQAGSNNNQRTLNS